MSDVAERVIAIVAEQLRLPKDRIAIESHLVDDLQADSLDVVDLTIAIEEEFSNDALELEIVEEDAEGLQTVQDIIDYLAAKGVV